MTKTYPLTLDKFNAIADQLKMPRQSTGIFTPPGHSEITLGYAYLNGSLQLTILHEAWYESADMIWSHLDPYFA